MILHWFCKGSIPMILHWFCKGPIPMILHWFCKGPIPMILHCFCKGPIPMILHWFCCNFLLFKSLDSVKYVYIIITFYTSQCYKMKTWLGQLTMRVEREGPCGICTGCLLKGLSGAKWSSSSCFLPPCSSFLMLSTIRHLLLNLLPTLSSSESDLSVLSEMS